MAKQQVHVCDADDCDTHRGVTTWVVLNGAQPRRADLCPLHAAPLVALWKTLPVPQEHRPGRRTEVVTMDDVAAARRRACGRPQDQS